MSTIAEISKRTDWEQMTREVNALIKRLRRKPVKNAIQLSPQGILNAYREGDLAFTRAVRELNRWRERSVTTTKGKMTELRIGLL